MLDDEEYKDILEEARNTAISLYPEWTDYNYHDPGITLLELFAFVKESQQYFLNQIGEENKEKYLKLLGITRRSKTAAKSLVKFQTDGNRILHRKSKLGAGELCFEIQGRKQLIGGDIRACSAFRGEQLTEYLDKGQMELGHSLGFRPFGREPRQGDAFYIRFDRALPEHTVLDLYIEVFKEYPVKRNPLGEGGFIPLVDLGFSCYTEKGWEQLTVIRDETYGFLFDGFLRFRLPGKMEQFSVHGEEGYYICVIFRDGIYDVAPVLTQISMNICGVRQFDTLIEYQIVPWAESIELDTELAITGRSDIWLQIGETFYPAEGFQKEIRKEDGMVFLSLEDGRAGQAEKVLVVNTALGMFYRMPSYEGNGFPYQKIDLEDLQVEYDSLQLLVQDVEHKGGYRMWEKVRDFGKSTPEDLHYVFDSRRGAIRFGDCIHGMAPEGKIIVIGYVRTMGSSGNVRQGKIDHFLMPPDTGMKLYNICDGYGGREEETLEECFLRAGKELSKPDCAVTGDDYEEYVKKTPGLMIEGCKVLQIKDIRRFVKKVDETAVYLVVKPYCREEEGEIGSGFYQNIRYYLERFRLIGSRIYIFLPEYVYVEVYTEAVVKPQYLHYRERLEEVIREFFDGYRSRFGGMVGYSELYGCIDKQEYITGIRSLNLDTRGNGVKRDQNGNILLSPNAIALLKDVRCSFVFG